MVLKLILITHIYMDNDMNIMLPVKKFSSIFKCAINLVNEEKNRISTWKQ